MSSRSLLTINSSQVPILWSSSYSSRGSGVRASSTDSGVRSTGRIRDISAMKRGTGGKSSFSGHVVTVFGCKGDLGTHLTARLGKHGHQSIIPYHKNHYVFQRLKLVGDLGQVLFTPFHLRDEESIRQAVKYSDVVVNCIDKQIDTRNFTVEDACGHAPGVLARICKEMGVDRFFQISNLTSLKSYPSSYVYPEGSRWLRAKTLGENNVREAFPEATIIRSADQLSPAGCKMNGFLFKKDNTLVRVPIKTIDGGIDVIKRPIHTSDVVSAIVACIDDPSTKGEIFQAYGDPYWFDDIISYSSNLINMGLTKRKHFVHSKWSHLKFMLKADRKMPVTELERFTYSDYPNPALPTIQDLGIIPRNVIGENLKNVLAGYVEELDGKEDGFNNDIYVPIKPIADLKSVKNDMKFGMEYGVTNLRFNA